MNEQERNASEADAFRRCRSVTESQDRQALEDFNRAQKDEAGRQPAAAEENPSSCPAVETSSDHAERFARARRGL